MEKTFIYKPDEFNRGMRKAIGLSGAVGKIDFIIFPLIFIASFFVSIQILASILRIVSILGILGLVYQLWILPKKTYNRESYYQEDYDIYLDQKKLVIMNMNGESEYRYRDFDEITKDHEFLFFKKDRNFIFLPLRIFTEEETMEVFQYLNPYLKMNRGKNEQKN